MGFVAPMGVRVLLLWGAERNLGHVGSGNDSDGSYVLRHRGPLRKGLQSALEEGTSQVMEPVLLVLIIVLLMAYLIFALLRPEKF
jgi:K+-transporting ATPase KdpF subunit